MKKIWKLFITISIVFLASALGGLFTANSVSTWYQELAKPFFNPPNWIFGPVWTLLYFLMGISLYLIWISKSNSNKKTALIFFAIQLFLNVLWSFLFFGLQNPFLAFVEIILLWLAIFATIFYFYKINKMSAYLLVPYILWVSFASVLNLSIFLLN